MLKHPFLCLVALVSMPCTPAFSGSVVSPVESHIGYDYATKVLMQAGQDCQAVRSTTQDASGSFLVSCISRDSKSEVLYRIALQDSGPPRATLVSRKAMPKNAVLTDIETRDAKVNRYATTIVRDYRYECAQVVRVTTQDDESLVAVCTPEYGRTPISYRLMKTPGAHMNVRVSPVE